MTDDEESRYMRFVRDSGLEDFKAMIEEVKEKEIKLSDLKDVSINNAKPGDVLVISDNGWVSGKVNETGDIVPLENYYTKPEADDLIAKKLDRTSMTSINKRFNDLNAGMEKVNTIETRIEKIETSPLPSPEEINAAPIQHDHDDLYHRKEIVDSIVDNINAKVIELDKPQPTLQSLGAASKDDVDYVASKVDNHEARLADVESLPAPTLTSLGASPLVHSHSVSDVPGLQEALNSASSKTDLSEVSSRVSKLELKPIVDAYSKIESDAKYGTKENMSQLTDRVSFLESKPSIDAYTKAQSDTIFVKNTDLSGMSTRLGLVESRSVIDSPDDIGAAPLSHNHSIDQIINLQTSLNAKANVGDLSGAVARIASLESRPIIDSPDDIGAATANDLSYLSTRVTNVEARPTFDSSLYYNKTQIDNTLMNKANVDYYPLSEYGMHSSSIRINDAISSVALTNGKIFFVRVFVPAGNSIAKVYFNVKTAGSLPGVATSGIAIFSDAGASLGTVLLNTLFTTVGWKTAVLASPIPAQSTNRFVYVGIVSNFSTIPAVYGLADGPWNGMPASHRRNISISSTTAFPTSFTPSTYGTTEIIMPFIGLGV